MLRKYFCAPLSGERVGARGRSVPRERICAEHDAQSYRGRVDATLNSKTQNKYLSRLGGGGGCPASFPGVFYACIMFYTWSINNH